MSLILYRNNSQPITLPNLRSGIDGSVKSDAVVTATLFEADGITVADPAIDGLVLSPVAGTPGLYRGRVDQSFDAPVGSYLLAITAVENGDEYYKLYRVRVKDNTGS